MDYLYPYRKKTKKKKNERSRNPEDTWMNEANEDIGETSGKESCEKNKPTLYKNQSKDS